MIESDILIRCVVFLRFLYVFHKNSSAKRYAAWRTAYYHQRDSEHTFFQTDFHKMCSKSSAIFWQWFLWNIKCSNLGITPIKITEILRNSWGNRRKFYENFKICRLLWKSTKIASNFAKLCESLEKSQKSGMVQRKKCRSRQELSNEYLLAKIGFDTAENELI